MLYECRENAPRMAAEYSSSVQEFKQNACQLYLACNTNVPGVSRILPEYFPMGINADEFSIFISQPL